MPNMYDIKNTEAEAEMKMFYEKYTKKHTQKLPIYAKEENYQCTGHLMQHERSNVLK